MWPHHPRTARLRQAPRRRRHRRGAARDGGVHVPAAARPEQHPPAVRPGRRQPARRGLLPGLRHPLGVRRGAGARLARRRRYQHGVDRGDERRCYGWRTAGSATFDCGFTLPLRGWLEITGTEGVVYVPEMWLPGPRATYMVRARRAASRRRSRSRARTRSPTCSTTSAGPCCAATPVPPRPGRGGTTLRVLDCRRRGRRRGGGARSKCDGRAVGVIRGRAAYSPTARARSWRRGRGGNRGRTPGTAASPLRRAAAT